MHPSHYYTKPGPGQGMRVLPVIHVYVPECHAKCATKDYPEPPADEIRKAIDLIKSRESTLSAQAKRLKTTGRRLILILLNKYDFDCAPFIKLHRKTGARN